MFLLALHKFGYLPGEVIHVGDSISSDVYGAKAAGIMPIWVNRKNKAIPHDVDKHVADLLGVIDILKAGEKQ